MNSTISPPEFFAVSTSVSKNNFFTKIAGRHTHYALNLSDNSMVIQTQFNQLAKLIRDTPAELKPYAFAHKSLTVRVKKLFLSNFVIRFLRNHMVNFVESDSKNILVHLRSTATSKRLNFVLLNDKLIVTEIRVSRHRSNSIKRIFDEILSKHAVLANGQAVLCSGEIWWDRKTKQFKINCDSGTYRPNFERTQLVAEIANRYFQNAPLSAEFEAVEK